jgi:hypothetical protein
MPSSEFDPREIERFIRPLAPRQELVYRLAARVLSPRCRRDRRFSRRTKALVRQFHEELPDLIGEADRVSARWMGSAR